MDSKRITALRAIMKREGIDYYYIPTADFHESEYVVEYFKARKFITGFTGSAGVAVIGQEEAWLWTLLYSGSSSDRRIRLWTYEDGTGRCSDCYAVFR